MDRLAALALAALLAGCEDANEKELKRFREQGAMQLYALTLHVDAILERMGSPAKDSGTKETKARAEFLAMCRARRRTEDCERTAREVERSPVPAMRWETPP